MRNTKLGRAVTPAVAAFVLGAAVLFAGPGGRHGEALAQSHSDSAALPQHVIAS